MEGFGAEAHGIHSPENNRNKHAEGVDRRRQARYFMKNINIGLLTLPVVRPVE